MTVSTTDSVIEYTGGGPDFPIPYRFLNDTDIVAQLVSADGEVTTLAMGTQYSLAGVGDQEGGALTSAYAATKLADGTLTLAISREMDPIQETDLRNQGRFYAETHETVFDYLTMLIQQGFSSISRALRRPAGKNYYDAEGRQIKNLGAPTLGTDAVNKTYVDAGDAATLASAADLVNDEAIARAAGDASLQEQLTGNVPLEASAFSPISWHDQVITNSVNIPANKNAWSFGPTLTIADGQFISIGENSFWTIADGAESGPVNTDSNFGDL